MKPKKTFTDEISGEEIELGSGIILNEKMHDQSKFDSVLADKEPDHAVVWKDHHDGGLGSIASIVDGDKKLLDSKQKDFAKKINIWQDRTRVNNSSERRLADYFEAIHYVQSQIYLPSVVTDQMRFFLRKLEKQRAIKGRHKVALVVALAKICSGILGYYFDVQSVRKQLGLRKSVVGKYMLHFGSMLDAKNKETTNTTLLFYKKFCTIFALPPKTIELGLSILTHNEKRNHTGGQSPKVVAAAAVCIAAKNSGIEIPNVKICSECKVNTASLLVARKKLAEMSLLLHYRKTLLSSIVEYKTEEASPSTYDWSVAYRFEICVCGCTKGNHSMLDHKSSFCIKQDASVFCRLHKKHEFKLHHYESKGVRRRAMHHPMIESEPSN